MCEDTCRGCDSLLPEHGDDHRGRCQIWCSKACGSRHRSPRPRAVPKLPGECAHCGASFVTHLSTRKFCNRFCSEASRGQRRAQPLPEIKCALPSCGKLFTPTYDRQRCCSERHGKALYNRASRADGRQKVESVWDDRRRDAHQRRRALKKKAATGRPVRRGVIAARDRYTCGICFDPVSMDLQWPHPLSPSLDHVIPLTKGGMHDPSNVQLAHLGCNTAKGNRVTPDVQAKAQIVRARDTIHVELESLELLLRDMAEQI